MTVPRIKLGNTGLQVSRLGYGASTIASLNTRYSAAEVRSTLNAAVDAGINFFDTADIYGQGDSERILGDLRKSREGEIVIATKVGLDLATSQTLVRWAKPVLQPLLRRWPMAHAQGVGLRHTVQRHCSDTVELRRRVHASLRRLQTVRLDLLLLHSPPVAWAERDEIRQMLQALVRDGLVHHCGVSAQSLADVPRWLAWPEVACLQLPLTLPSGESELPVQARRVVQAAALRGVGIVAREVLAGGARAATAASRESALRAVLHLDGVHSVLLGMGCRSHLRQNLSALKHALPEHQPA